MLQVTNEVLNYRQTVPNFVYAEKVLYNTQILVTSSRSTSRGYDLQLELSKALLIHFILIDINLNILDRLVSHIL